MCVCVCSCVCVCCACVRVLRREIRVNMRSLSALTVRYHASYVLFCTQHSVEADINVPSSTPVFQNSSKPQAFITTDQRASDNCWRSLKSYCNPVCLRGRMWACGYVDVLGVWVCGCPGCVGVCRSLENLYSQPFFCPAWWWFWLWGRDQFSSVVTSFFIHVSFNVWFSLWFHMKLKCLEILKLLS